MYFASFAKKVFLRAGRVDSAVRVHARRCARRVCGAQLVFCQRPDHGVTESVCVRTKLGLRRTWGCKKTEPCSPSFPRASLLRMNGLPMPIRMNMPSSAH
eukprot:scaffold89432_cov67-Phaeocystis_antarctica.AAC.5